MRAVHAVVSLSLGLCMCVCCEHFNVFRFSQVERKRERERENEGKRVRDQEILQRIEKNGIGRQSETRRKWKQNLSFALSTKYVDIVCEKDGNPE